MSSTFMPKCPYCKGPASKKIYTVQIIQSFWGTNLNSTEAYNIEFCCNRCGITFLYPNLSKEVIEGGTVSERSR